MDFTDKTLRIWTLGSLHIRLAGQALAGLPTRKVQALLLYLASQPGVNFSREHLQGLLWSESAPPRAAASLRQALSTLRRALPEGYLTADGAAVAWRTDASYWLDVNHVHEEPELYRDEFLHGFVVRKAPLWEGWVTAQRERVRLTVLEALLAQGEAAQQQQPEVALAVYQRALTLEPWREHTHQQIMRLHWRLGDRTAALHQYEQCVEMLAEELGVVPGAETVALAQRIGQGEKLSPHNLPAPGSQTSFVGRREEMEALSQLLAANRLVTVVGAGGMGKTRLALEAARHSLPHYPDGVWLVQLESISGASSVVPAVADVLGVQFSGSASPQEQLLAYLQQKQLLLLLDNYEQLLPATEFIRGLLRRTSGVCLLVTSRQRLNLRTEQIFSLAGLGLPTAETRDPTHSEAVQFFVAAAQRVQPSFRAATEMTATVRLCRVLEGMPLGLELAAAWLRLLPVARVIEEIERTVSFLGAKLDDAPGRQRSLEAVFDYSWALLGREEQQALARLPVFRGGFDLAAWRQVVRLPVQHLMALADKSLVQREAKNTPQGERGERFRLHARLRQYVAERHADADAALAHSRYFLGRLAEHEPDLARGRVRDQQAIARRLLPDMENVRAAWAWAVGHAAWDDVEGTLDALFALYYQVLNRFEELLALLTNAVEALAPLARVPTERLLLGSLYVYRSRVLNLLGEFEPALAAAEAALDLADEMEDLHLRAEALARIGHIHQREGNAAEATRALQEALGIAEAQNLPIVAGNAYSNLGTLALFESDNERALHHYRRALSLRQRHDSEINAVIDLNNLAALVDDYAQKTLYTEEVIAVSKAAGDRITWGLALSNYALNVLDVADYQRAYEMYCEAISVLEPTGDLWVLGTYVLNNAANACRYVGALDEASAHALRALALCRRLQAPRGEGMAFVHLGLVSMLKGEMDAARDHFQAGLSLFAEIGEEWWGYMAARRNWGIYCYKMGDFEAAEMQMREVLALDSAQGNASNIAFDHIWLALLAAERGANNQAHHLLRLAAESARAANIWRLLPDVCVVFALIAKDELVDDLLAVAHAHPASSWPSRQWAEEMAARLGRPLCPLTPNIPASPARLSGWLLTHLA